MPKDSVFGQHHPLPSTADYLSDVMDPECPSDDARRRAGKLLVYLMEPDRLSGEMKNQWGGVRDAVAALIDRAVKDAKGIADGLKAVEEGRVRPLEDIRSDLRREMICQCHGSHREDDGCKGHCCVPVPLVDAFAGEPPVMRAAMEEEHRANVASLPASSPIQDRRCGVKMEGGTGECELPQGHSSKYLHRTVGADDFGHSCPACGEKGHWLKGPEGGLSINIQCGKCGNRYNDSPGIPLEWIGHKDMKVCFLG